MKKILIATGNLGKFKEILNVLRDLPFEFLSLGDLNGGGVFDLVEDGETFAENSLKKASYFAARFGLPTLAEDSGVLVDALPGELGVRTRRWGAGELASDDEWIEFFMRRMESVPDLDRGACFVCNACFVDLENGIEKFFEGETCGHISRTLMAPLLSGLPLSSCFIPDGHSKAYAELTADEKAEISHRGQAISKFRDYLKSLAS